jgi:signal transduction histidine kinase
MAATYTHEPIRGPADPAMPPSRTWIVLASGLLCAASVALAASGAPSDAVFGRALLQLLVVGVPLAAGIYALRARVNRRFGVALLAISFVWSLTALGEASLSVPYTLGRMATWLTVPTVFYLLLAFPDGRIAGGLDRALLYGVAAVSAVLFFGTVFLVEAFPVHTPWATCTNACPANALFALDRQPAFMADAIIPLRECLIDLLWVGMVVSLVRRWRAASPLQRSAMAPVVVLGTVMGACQIAFYTARELDAPANLVEALAFAWALCIAGVSAAFLFGLFRRRLTLASALARLGGALAHTDDAGRVRDAVAAALSDPQLRLWSRDGADAQWRDERGVAIEAPETPAPGRAVTIIDGDDRLPALAVVHDVALRDDPELLDGVSSLLLTEWRHDRLVSILAAAMADLEESRRRIAEAADVERARIERDLHDGAQQRLIALRIRLGMADEAMGSDPARAAVMLREIGAELERAMDELRSFADGVYPSVLTDWGLEHALRAVARDVPLRVEVVAEGVTRHPVEIEAAVYFVCVEALQNAMKHAPAATDVRIRLTESSGVLAFEVTDDGPGFVPDPHGQRGLRHMRERIEAIGGRWSVESAPGSGTRIAGAVEV